MKNAKLVDMVRGWFIGGFSPTVYDTHVCEVGVKIYKGGEYESPHYHKVASEITLILSGHVEMCGRKWGPGDIVLIEPGEATDFRALTDTTTVVVKIPGAIDDKYLL